MIRVPLGGMVLPLTLAGVACQCAPTGTISPGSAAEAAEPAPAAEAGGVEVQVARWYYGKQSAISVQFEGSDPSQLAFAVPLVNRYSRRGSDTAGQPFIATFLLDRESASYQAHREEWENAARDSLQEFHPTDVKAPKVLTVGSDPEKADIVGLDAFKQRVDESVAAGEWTTFSFRAIGQQAGLGVGEEDFRQMMNYLHMRPYYWQGWVGGLSQVRKYEVERDAARVSAEVVGPSKVKIELECGTDPEVYDQPLTLDINFGRQWPDPTRDVTVLDSDGKPVLALRRRRQLLLSVPPRGATFYVQAEPRAEEPILPDESARSVRDPATGLAATVCRWRDGKRAAVSFRFDDSYTNNILKAVPMLREYGYTGTFLINPGNSAYQSQQAAWEACAARGDQEFGNHTMHHFGALNDDEVDREIGETCRYIWGLFPGRSKLVCFIRGGGTVWIHSKPFRYFADKYHLVMGGPRASIGMTDGAEEEYRARLNSAIEGGVWFGSSYHQIALPWLSEETFRRVLEITRERESEIWAAGIADIYKYQQERNASALALRRGEGDTLALALTCGTDRELYDQPLTLELALPEGWSAATLKVRDAQGKAMATRAATAEGRAVVRFEVPPTKGEYTISR